MNDLWIAGKATEGADMALTLNEARTQLAAHGQEHVLDHWERLDEPARATLLEQIEALSWVNIERMQRELQQAGTASGPAAVEPDAVLELDADALAEAATAGEAALRSGRVGVILVAGGQGSRLGYDGPKGCYPVGPLSDDTLFAIHAKKIIALERRYETAIPFYVMTSVANDAPTRAFFADNDCFGMAPERVKFFTQGMWPGLWPDGRLVLEAPDRIFVSPDGHGGTLSALKDTGMLDDMATRGVDTLYYFQVDNPMVHIAEPAFVGVHVSRGCDMSLKVCAKRDAQEGLGVVVRSAGRPGIVEYSDLTEAQKSETGPDGRLKLLFGSVAIHIFSREFLEKEAVADMPLHVAHKKVPYCDAQGEVVKPDNPNAYKFEKFIFDALPDADTSVNLAFDREDEFSPVKNAEGADSPETCKRDLGRKFAGWLEACGCTVPRGSDGYPLNQIEIDPLFANSAEELREQLGEPITIDADILLAEPVEEE